MKQACVLSPATHSIRRFILEQQHADILCLSAGFAADVDEFDCRLIRSSTESVTVIEGIPAAQTATIVVVGDCCEVVRPGSAASLPVVCGLLQIPNVTRR